MATRNLKHLWSPKREGEGKSLGGALYDAAAAAAAADEVLGDVSRSDIARAQPLRLVRGSSGAR